MLGSAQDTADAAFMLYALAERLAEVPGRKLVVLFSGSLSTFAGEPGGHPRGTNSLWAGWPAVAPPESKPGADKALQSLALRLGASRAAVYGLHLEGARPRDEGVLVADRQEYSSNGRTLRRNTQAGRRQDAFTRPTDDFLSSLAAESGGTYTARATDFGRILEGIEASNRLWYELSFAPAETDIPGSYRSHEVRVRNRGGVTVVARAGHVVPE